MNAFIMFRSRLAARIGISAPGKIAMLWGEQDRVFLPKRAELLLRLRPDASFTFIAGAGHLPHQEKPDACAAEMLKFLQQKLGL
jgi:pimeloyl-ACP methyl ester carboxylesterase